MHLKIVGVMIYTIGLIFYFLSIFSQRMLYGAKYVRLTNEKELTKKLNLIQINYCGMIGYCIEFLNYAKCDAQKTLFSPGIFTIIFIIDYRDQSKILDVILFRFFLKVIFNIRNINLDDIKNGLLGYFIF